MSWKLVVKSSAETDVLDGYLDYEGRLNGLGERYLSEIEDALLRIKSNSYLYQEIDPDIRRAVVRKFPYLVFYTIEGETIFVLAILHAAQNPKYIATRLLA